MIRHARHHDRISIDPAVMLGKPVVRGTRITVEQILRELVAGMATEEILAAHPRLTADDIRAAQSFALEATRQSRAVTTSSYVPRTKPSSTSSPSPGRREARQDLDQLPAAPTMPARPALK